MSGLRFHIILVEDAEPDVLLVREALEQSGLDFELMVFDDGEQGVDFIETWIGTCWARVPTCFYWT